jgi:hypothetical protein
MIHLCEIELTKYTAGMNKISDSTLGKIVNMGTLFLGLVLGFAAGAFYYPRLNVEAQVVIPPSPQIKEITPGITTGSLGTNLILAHEIAADSVVVNGYDVMRMEQAILNYLATRPTAEAADIQNIVNASRATTIYRLAPPKATPPATLPTPGKKQ